MNTLRGRLLGSYVLVIGLCLTIVALALFVILRDNPLPDRQTFQRLSDIARASLPSVAMPASRNQDALFERLTEIGKELGYDVQVYDGSFDEWSGLLDLPLEQLDAGGPPGPGEALHLAGLQPGGRGAGGGDSASPSRRSLPGSRVRPRSSR